MTRSGWNLRNKILSNPREELCNLVHAATIAVGEIQLKAPPESSAGWVTVKNALDSLRDSILNADEIRPAFTPVPLEEV